MNQPAVSTSKGLRQKSLPGDTTVETVNNSDSDAYENVDISEGDDKISPVINTLTTKFQDVYRPEDALTIDEAICRFRGHIYFHVYMKRKPHKYGIKIFEMCKLKGGYVCTLEVYTGTNPADTDFNRSFIINRLCSLVEPIIYMDRWFSSPKLFNHLWACGTKIVGSVMPNRK
jgi:hypothetical protein